MDDGRPLVVEVRRGSLEDGPGLRSVVFYKGCPLRCVFCHNPEAQERGSELAFSRERCGRCRRCARACPVGAIDLEAGTRIDRSRCERCGRCAEACPTGALRLVGRYWPVEELAELLLRDRAFYRRSGGGVTLSGGECTLFPDHAASVSAVLKASDVHVALETSGYFDYEVLARRLLPVVDLVLFDVKLVDPEASRRHLGVSSERILENLRRLLADGRVEVQPRIPLIPGITDSPENLAAIVERLSRWGATQVSVLPYNPMGLDGHARLGRAAPELPRHFTPPEEERARLELVRELCARHRTGSCPPGDVIAHAADRLRTA